MATLSGRTFYGHWVWRVAIVTGIVVAPAGPSTADSRGACAWQPGFGDPFINGEVYALATFDDGNGPALYAAGHLTEATSIPVAHIARCDGTAWSALTGPSETGVSGDLYALEVFDDGSGPALYAGGAFSTAGGIGSSHIGAWSCPSEVFAHGFENGSTAAWSLTAP